MSTVPSIGAVCSLAFRAARPRSARTVAIGMKRAALTRGYADKSTNDPSKLPKAPAKDHVGPNMQQAEHVSEEAAKMAKITGNQGPDIEGQGTSVQEILKNEPEVKANAPQVLKSDSNSAAAGKRSFSTYARSMQQSEIESGENTSGGLDLSMTPTSEQRAAYASSKNTLVPTLSSTSLAIKPTGHKFPLPQLPLPPRDRAKHRDEPLVTQLTKLMMRDGKLARAQRWMAYILNALRSAPAPKYSMTRPLMPGAPPASHLPLDPVAYLTLAIDSLAPLIRIRRIKGAAGGGAALELPAPLTVRQRRRTAFHWILKSAEKKQSRAGGKYSFPQKVADEIISVVEGKSANWTKRDALHKIGTVNRSNLTKNRFKRR